ncbi:hypothetical protein JCM3770_003512 [Rhodotorula araucariae]
MPAAKSSEPKAKSRSDFVLKLHRLLSAEAHPEYIHWLDNETFAITSVDADARIALAPEWDFRSLSSFIRQLSYYSFKRLSDRRRSSERRSSLPAFIVFGHPTGNFVRDDATKTALILRKQRARQSIARRKSNPACTGEQDYTGYPPSPGGEHDIYEQPKGDKLNFAQLGLAGYQLPPWSSIEPQGRTIYAEPCPTPGAVPPHAATPMRGIREGSSHSPFESFYPSPTSAPSSAPFLPPDSTQACYYAGQPVVPSPPDHAYYHSSAQSLYASFAPDRLPPLHAVTARIAPPPPPADHYAHHPQAHAAHLQSLRQPDKAQNGMPSPHLISSAPPATHPGMRYAAAMHASDDFAAENHRQSHWTQLRAIGSHAHVHEQMRTWAPAPRPYAHYAESPHAGHYPHAPVPSGLVYDASSPEDPDAYADELEQQKVAYYAGGHDTVATRD